MKTNQIDVVAFTMFSHFEQIEHAQETRLSRQRWSNIGKPDQCDRIDLDLSLSYAITLAFFYMGAHPYSDAAGDFPSNHPFAEALCENHQATPILALVNCDKFVFVESAAIISECFVCWQSWKI
jgi:hypothetical protein